MTRLNQSWRTIRIVEPELADVLKNPGNRAVVRIQKPEDVDWIQFEKHVNNMLSHYNLRPHVMGRYYPMPNPIMGVIDVAVVHTVLWFSPSFEELGGVITGAEEQPTEGRFGEPARADEMQRKFLYADVGDIMHRTSYYAVQWDRFHGMLSSLNDRTVLEVNKPRHVSHGWFSRRMYELNGEYTPDYGGYLRSGRRQRVISIIGVATIWEAYPSAEYLRFFESDQG